VKKCFNPVQGGADVTNRDLPVALFGCPTPHPNQQRSPTQLLNPAAQPAE